MSQHVHDEIERHECAVAEQEREVRIRRFRGWWFAFLMVLSLIGIAGAWYNIGYAHGERDATKHEQPAEKPQ